MNTSSISQEPSFTVLLQESHCNIEETQYSHIESKEVLESVFSKINSTREPGLSIPEIDFSESSVLFLAMGQRTTGGYTISVDRIVTEDNNWVVFVKKKGPGPTDFVTDVITTPYILVSIPKTTASIVFRDLD